MSTKSTHVCASLTVSNPHMCLLLVQGGGCGVGFGFGWGFFLVAIGTPFKRLQTLIGREDRMLDRAMDKLNEDREAGLIPPFSAGLPERLQTNDPFLDRVIRSILARRARMRDSRQNRISPLRE